MTNRLLPARFTTPWAITGWLWALGALPILFAGVFSLSTALGLIEPPADLATYAVRPLPIILHIVGGSIMMILGPLQVNPRLRIRRRRLHKALGRVFVLGGFAAGLSAIWMAQTFPRISGELTYLTNMVFGIGLTTALVLGLAAIRWGDVARHKAWILRGYALALGPATQRLFILPAFGILGPLEDPALGLLLILGWGINLMVVERIIRRNAVPRAVAAAA